MCRAVVSLLFRWLRPRTTFQKRLELLREPMPELERVLIRRVRHRLGGKEGTAITSGTGV